MKFRKGVERYLSYFSCEFFLEDVIPRKQKNENAPNMKMIREI